MTQPTPQSTSDIHLVDDVDTGPLAHHHTLGEGSNNAAPGKHGHATLITPINVTGGRGGNVALANLLTALATKGIITDSTTP